MQGVATTDAVLYT